MPTEKRGEKGRKRKKYTEREEEKGTVMWIRICGSVWSNTNPDPDPGQICHDKRLN